MAFAAKGSSRVEELSTEVEKIQLLMQNMQKLQSLRDKLEKLPNCKLRETLLSQVGLLLDSDNEYLS